MGPYVHFHKKISESLLNEIININYRWVVHWGRKQDN